MKMIIYGATEIGCLLATEFFEDHDVTIIDKEENRTDEFQKLDISFVHGNASDSDILKLADINSADVFIACTNVDEANIVACLSAKKMSGIRTICFVNKAENKNVLVKVTILALLPITFFNSLDEKNPRESYLVDNLI